MAARSYFIGTMGWSYEDWKGVFYGEKARQGDLLASYSDHFDAVEVDSSFYGFPTPRTIERWCRVTPDHFRFTLKCPQEITHELQLEGVEDQVRAVLEECRRFEGKLGVLLFQFPPSFRAAAVVRLKRLFDLLPADVPCAVELRHASWWEVGAIELARDYGVSWAVSDQFPEVHLTGPNLYLRLLGDHAWEPTFDRVQREVEGDVQGWASQLLQLAPEVTTVYGFVNNHYSGHSPATASRLRELLGLQPIVVYRQGTLF